MSSAHVRLSKFWLNLDAFWPRFSDCIFSKIPLLCNSRTRLDTKNIKATCLNLTKGPGAKMEWWNFDIFNLDYRLFFLMNTGRFSLFTLSSMEELIAWTTSMNSVLMFLPVHCHQRWKGKAQTCQDLKHIHNLKRHQHLNQLSRMKIIGLHKLTELTPDIHSATAFVREI